MKNIDELFAKRDVGLDEVLSALRLDRAYERAEGDYLFSQSGDQLTPILDLVGGFGVNLLGHYHPKLVATLEDAVAKRVPFSDQGSVRMESARLRDELRQRFGAFAVVLTNSGTETVEAAIKHACLESGKTDFFSVRRSYHGKTLGSLSLTSRQPNRAAPRLGMTVDQLDPEDPATWAHCETRQATTAGIFVEPIQGEGGIRVLPEDFCAWLQKYCNRTGIPLIADEIQCGLGRAGSWLASTELGLVPDYICLGKALGGGLVKVGALLVDERRFRADFRWLHTSTFAGDGLSSRVAREVLAIIERDQVPARCGRLGAAFCAELMALQAKWPHVLCDVRGRGLMLGVELADQAHSRSNALRLLSQHQLLGFLATSYLLNRHQIRVAPTISHPHTLRLQPSAYFSEDNLQCLIQGLNSFCEAVDGADAGKLLGHVCEPGGQETATGPFPPQQINADRHSEGNKVAFIAHPLEAADLKHWDTSLHALSEPGLRRLSELGTRLLGPCIYDQYSVRSQTGQMVHLTWIGLLPTSAQMYAAQQAAQAEPIVRQIEEAVRMAAEQGCHVAGLGGYTSIVTGNCQRISQPELALTSGNALTVGMCMRAAEEVAKSHAIPVHTAAVIGASGNIGKAYARCLAPQVEELILVVRRSGSRRSRRLLEELQSENPGKRIQLTSSLEAVQRCQWIVGASNSPEPVIAADHLGKHPCVICDVALPSDLAADVAHFRPQAHIIRGGIVRLPHNEALTLSGLNLPAGCVFACIAETLLMGLEGERAHGSYGDLSTERIQKLLRWADRHGFRHEILFRAPQFAGGSSAASIS